MKKFKPSSIILFTTMLLLTAACTQPELTSDASAQANNKKVTSLVLQSSDNILQQMEKVANWQVPRIDSLTYLNFKRGESLEQGRWVQGAFYIGLTEIAERSSNPFYTHWIEYKAKQLNWQLGKVPYFGDDQLIAQTYIWYFLNHQQNPAFLAPTKVEFDQILAQHQDTSLEFTSERTVDETYVCQNRWCWADALFMAPASWLGLSKITGDLRYAEHAHKEVKATVDYLFDPAYNLLYRDSRFKTEKDAFGNQLFWARGSGWVFAGLARMMEFIPKDDPNRPFYENLFTTMAAKLKTLQKQDGTWAMSLLSVENSPQPETSGTAFFTYGMTWGINEGLLPEQEYLPNVIRGWNALNSAVHPDGKLGWVQQIGDAPDNVSYDDSQIYAVGAYLLAGSELYDFQLAKEK
jgi:unsaturated rhamnogalacturonyl hydrolase